MYTYMYIYISPDTFYNALQNLRQPNRLRTLKYHGFSLPRLESLRGCTIKQDG